MLFSIEQPALSWVIMWCCVNPDPVQPGTWYASSCSSVKVVCLLPILLGWFSHHRAASHWERLQVPGLFKSIQDPFRTTRSGPAAALTQSPDPGGLGSVSWLSAASEQKTRCLQVPLVQPAFYGRVTLKCLWLYQLLFHSFKWDFYFILWLVMMSLKPQYVQSISLVFIF